MGATVPKTSQSPVGRPFVFVSQWRSLPLYELVSYVCMFASVPMLAYGIRPYDSSTITIVLLSVVALYAGFFAALIWNDITDVDIDAVVHPDRPLPSGRISFKKFFAVALVFSAMTFVFSYLVSFWCFLLVGAAALFVTFHNKYLKKIVAFPAYSEIFTPLQWVIVPLFGYLAIAGLNIQQLLLLVLFTYFADNAHDLPEGIHDIEGDRKTGVKTYATSFGEKNAARVSFAMFFISGILGILLFYTTILQFVFLLPFLALWLYTLYYAYKLVTAEKNQMKNLGALVGRKGFNYFLIAYDLIFLDVLVQVVLAHY